MNFMLGPEQQALTYDKGYFYPGPAVKDVTLSMAPEESQEVIQKFGRPEYDAVVEQFPHALPLERQGDGRSVPKLGPRGRRAKDEVSSRGTRGRVRRGDSRASS